MSWKVISGALVLIGILSGVWIIGEVRMGVVHTRGGTIAQAENPEAFWLVVVASVLWIAFCLFCAAKSWRKGKREPNF